MKKLVAIRWCCFYKWDGYKVHAMHCFPITSENEYLLKDNILAGEADEWFRQVDSCEGYGWSSTYTLYDSPPADWIEAQKKSLPAEIEHKTALLELLNTY